jgi:putative PIN family toxin of toxin-antitoxin system
VRVALDTNVLVSAVATRGLCADIFNLVLAEHQLIVGEAVLGELRRVLREKFRVPGKVLDEFEALLRQEGETMKVAEHLTIKVRDESDVIVLSEAVSGNAEVLVTGDRDLLAVTDKLPIEILTPRGFWERVRGQARP